MVVQAVHSDKGGNSKLSMIISCFKNLLVCNPNFDVKFVKRLMNLITHLLVKVIYS